MDREDWLYCLGGVSISAGCGWMYPPAALVSIGTFLLLPVLVSMFRAKGPQ